MKDYSQSGEQDAILRVAEAVDVGRTGPRFLDIGAGDGRKFSNTHQLALAGWAGVCVEPAPWSFDRLTRLYAGTRIECVSAVVTPDRCGLTTFLYARGDLISSTEEAHAEKWGRALFERVTVAAVSLADLLDWAGGGFSVVSIDTEGTTLALLDAYRRHPAWDAVQCLCVEIEYHSQRAVAIPAGWTIVAETPNNLVLAR